MSEPNRNPNEFFGTAELCLSELRFSSYFSLAYIMWWLIRWKKYSSDRQCLYLLCVLRIGRILANVMACCGCALSCSDSMLLMLRCVASDSSWRDSLRRTVLSDARPIRPIRFPLEPCSRADRMLTWAVDPRTEPALWVRARIRCQ